MADNLISSFPIADLLSALGARPGNYKNTFHSPFREDANASLHIDPVRNVWFDHGAGIGGGNIDLVIKCRGGSPRDAAQYILSLQQGRTMPGPAINGEKITKEDFPTAKPLASRIRLVRDLRSPYLLRYMAFRGIPEAIATRYCEEVILRGKVDGRLYDNIGFRNNNGGYSLKAPSGFKSTTKAGVTTIDTQGGFSEVATSRMVSVFEGFFDFLSWLAKGNTEVPSTDVVVLNSVSNIRRAVPYLRIHDTIICYLDNDEAGQTALETLKRLREDLYHPTILDGSSFYDGYKDLNEWWATRMASPRNKR